MQWIKTLETYAFPIIGDRSVDAIERPEILKILQPIWLRVPETARRVRQRLRTVFAWTITAEHREAANSVTDIALGLPPQKGKGKHFPALPWEALPDFMAELDGVKTISALALRFAILTCARSGEVRGARWSEIDAEARHWVVPAERMKAGSEHRVPLGDEVRAILEQVRGLHPELIFPGQKGGKPVSDTTLRALLKRMKRTEITVHGFRPTFRDWVSDATDFSGDLAEHCLAHRVGSVVERAYARSDRLGKRRTLLESWEAYCLSDRESAASDGLVAKVGAFA